MAAGVKRSTYLSTVVLRVLTTLQTAAAMSAAVLVCTQKMTKQLAATRCRCARWGENPWFSGLPFL